VPCARVAVTAGFAVALIGIAAGCGSSGTGLSVTVRAARTFRLVHFAPAGATEPDRPIRVSFTIRAPDGSPFTAFKTGPGPHTGVHLLLVRTDLSGPMLQIHPPIGRNGVIGAEVVFPTPAATAP
jgi:hypothetical protein